MRVVTLLLFGAFWVSVFADEGLLGLFDAGALLVIGLTVVLPLTRVLTTNQETDRRDETRQGDETEDDRSDALATVRRRYAEGELNDREFERQLERLLETETLSDVRENTEREREPDAR